MTAPEMVPQPPTGRVFRAERRVRLGDASPGGRLRFDSLARYLQDVSDDDTRNVELPEAAAWVVRANRMIVHRFPVFQEELALSTWCSGLGSRWAGRRIDVVGDRGAKVSVEALWVHVDLDAMRPAKLSDVFISTYREAAQGRTLRASLHHDDTAPAGADTKPWPLRFADFDVLGHVNNAAYWSVLDEQLARRRDLRAPCVAEIEHRNALERDAAVEVDVHDDDDGVRMWIRNGPALSATGCVRMLSEASA